MSTSEVSNENRDSGEHPGTIAIIIEKAVELTRLDNDLSWTIRLTLHVSNPLLISVRIAYYIKFFTSIFYFLSPCIPFRLGINFWSKK